MLYYCLMAWLFFEALLALSLLVGFVVWVMLPAKKKGRGLKQTAPAEKANLHLQERREEASDPSETEGKSEDNPD